MQQIEVVTENGDYLEMSFSEEAAYTDGCDSCIEYTLYDGSRHELDGGQMDYDSVKAGYGNDIRNAITDVLSFALSIEPDSLPRYYIGGEVA